MRAFLVALVLGIVSGWPVPAQDLSALARLDPAASFVRDDDAALEVTLALSQPVPWRVRLADDPRRLILDFREVDWSGAARMPVTAAQVAGVRAGPLRPGWSRMVMELAAPMVLDRAEMDTDATSGATLRLRLVAADAPAFAAAATQPAPADWALPPAADLPAPAVRGDGPLVVVLDPGHGGIDPGAERDGHSEADLMLTFARELKALLIRDGRFRVVMTRDEDLFVPLESRISVARAAGGHVFLSLHADALAEGEAVGATVYTLADEASDAAAQTLAERHDRDDLLSGIDLARQDDLVATVLMDMARAETRPRIDRLAETLREAISGAGLQMHRNPVQQAGFSVLKSPDIPSVLIELGFLSSASDLERLLDPDWRARMALAIRDALLAWAAEDAALSALTRG